MNKKQILQSVEDLENALNESVQSNDFDDFLVKLSYFQESVANILDDEMKIAKFNVFNQNLIDAITANESDNFFEINYEFKYLKELVYRYLKIDHSAENHQMVLDEFEKSEARLQKALKSNDLELFTSKLIQLQKLVCFAFSDKIYKKFMHYENSIVTSLCLVDDDNDKKVIFKYINIMKKCLYAA